MMGFIVQSSAGSCGTKPRTAATPVVLLQKV